MELFNLRNYYNNPSGKGSAIVNNQKQLKEQYQDTLSKIEDKIKIKWYKLKNTSLICHILLPSSSLDKISYDVLFQFNTGDLDKINERNINDIPMKVFSNCPSFTFTYAYTFNKNKMIIDWLKIKIPDIVLTKKSEVRNKYNIISYEKSLYLSVLYLMDGRTNLSLIKQIAIPINDIKQITNKINRSDYIVDLYNFEKSKLKPKETKNSKPNTIKPKNNSFTKNQKSIKSVSKTKKVKKTAKSKKVKKI